MSTWEKRIETNLYIYAYRVGGSADKTNVSTLFPPQPANSVGVSHLNTSLHKAGAAIKNKSVARRGSPNAKIVHQCGAKAGLARGKTGKRPQAENQSGQKPQAQPSQGYASLMGVRGAFPKLANPKDRRMSKKKSKSIVHRRTRDAYRWRNLRTETHTRGDEEIGGYVYIFKIGYENLYKIGWAKDWQSRLTQLQAGNPRICCVMAFAFRNANKIEKRLHKKYKKSKEQREIFNLNPTILSEIHDYLYKQSQQGGFVSMDLDEGKIIRKYKNDLTEEEIEKARVMFGSF